MMPLGRRKKEYKVSGSREILEQAGRNEDMGCSSEVVRKGFVAIGRGQQMGRLQRRMESKRKNI